MDNNNQSGGINIDPTLMAPQDTPPTAPVTPITSSTPAHLIDITPGAPDTATSTTIPLVAPMQPVQNAPLPDNKVVDITPNDSQVPPITTPVVSAPLVEPIIAPLAPLAPVTPAMPVTPTPTPLTNPLQEDPNLVKTIS